MFAHAFSSIRYSTMLRDLCLWITKKKDVAAFFRFCVVPVDAFFENTTFSTTVFFLS